MPPVPTFTGAFVGGIVATNAAGAATFKYGTTRDWVRGLTGVLANGDVLEVERGQTRAHADGYFEIVLSDRTARVPVPLVTGGGHVNNAFLYAHVPYDPMRDFDAVTLGASQPVVLTVHPSVPAQSVKELVALVKGNPGKYSFASPGVGTPPSLVGELFRLSLAPDLVHVPFNGGGPAVGSTVAGHTPVSFGAVTPAVPLVKDGKLRALAVTSKTRTKALPDTPTMAEAGYPEVEGTSWAAVVVPAGTPKEIIGYLHREIVAIIALAEVKERLAALGFEPVASTPEELAARAQVEFETWAKVIRGSGIKAQ